MHLVYPPKFYITIVSNFSWVLLSSQEKIDVNSYHRLREVPHFSSGILKWAKRERAWKSPHARKEDTCGLFSVRKRTCFGPRNSKIVYQNSRLSTIPRFNMIKVNRYDNRGKISRTSKKNLWIEKITDTCSPTLITDQNLAHTLRFLKEEIRHKMCWIFPETLPISLPIRCALKKIVYASWKVLKICLRTSKRWLILSDSVRCFENFWSLERCFDLFVDKEKRALSLVEKCRVTSWPCP